MRPPFFFVLATSGALALGGCGANRVASTSQNAVSRAAARAAVDAFTGKARGARDEARTLKSLSDTRLAARDYPGAMSARWEMMGIRGGQISPGKSLSSKAIQALALRDLEPLASHLDASACRRFAAELEALEARSSYADELKTKRDKEIKFFRRMSRDPQDWQKTIVSLFKGQDQQTMQNTSPAQIEANIKSVYLELIDNARQPYSTTVKEVPADPYTKRYAVPFRMEKFIAARYQTDRLLNIAALRARADKLEKRGANAKLPRDPFGSGPLRTKNGLIYSIGPDLKDDGGMAVPAAESLRETARGDLVAPSFSPETNPRAQVC